MARSRRPDFRCGGSARFANRFIVNKSGVRAPLSRILSIAACGAALTACGGPPVASPLADEPTCLDYESASHDKMSGGVRVPVTVSVLGGLDGKKPVATALIRGLRAQNAAKTALMLPDADAEYTVEWAQCANRQPERSAKDGPDPAYKCEGAKVYKTDKLVTKKGDAASRTLHYAHPPDATCHIGPAPEPPPAPTGSASAAPAP